MTQNKNTVKLIILSAFLAVIVLVAVCIFQLVSIYKKNELLEKQNQQIEQLNKELDFYNNFDSSTPDNEILKGEEI